MEQYVIALILGVIEGITECIPVSSTGHMIIIGHMLNFEGAHADEEKMKFKKFRKNTCIGYRFMLL